MKFNSCEPQRCFIHLVFLWVNGFRHFCGLFIHFYRAVDVMINEFDVVACFFDLNKMFLFYLFHTAESYQYQLQSMWQKCWNSQNLVQHMRFRERGPLKSWRPETMAEAIFSVLKEGLSLSQAARKYDIPYPTVCLHFALKNLFAKIFFTKFQFVLYANRVHNMLGPSMDGGTDLRPKGRGRPQRILLGIWPDEHIKAVIKSVVFRDEKIIKEDPMIYGRQSVSFPHRFSVSQRDP